MDCWQKLKDFHDFCIHIENVHSQEFSAGAKCGDSPSFGTDVSNLQNEIDVEFKPIVHQLEEASAHHDSEIAMTIAAGPKKRGRPRKTQLLEQSVSDDKTNEIISTDKYLPLIAQCEKSLNIGTTIAATRRKRGRPRRFPLIIQSVKVDTESEINSTNDHSLIPEIEPTRNIEIPNDDDIIKKPDSFDLGDNSPTSSSDSDDYFSSFFRGKQNNAACKKSDYEAANSNASNMQGSTKKMRRQNSKNVSSKSISIICELCGHSSASKSVYKSHYEARHMNITYECDICGKL